MKQNNKVKELWDNSKEYRKKVFDYFVKKYNLSSRDNQSIVGV